MSNFKVGSRLFALHDKELKGMLTWMEKGTSAIMLFTSGLKAEEYATKVHEGRPLVVYPIEKSRMRNFVHSMMSARIEYALIDVPPEHADIDNLHEDEKIRNYAIVDLRSVVARMM